jgi:hypothetical protein
MISDVECLIGLRFVIDYPTFAECGTGAFQHTDEIALGSLAFGTAWSV